MGSNFIHFRDIVLESEDTWKGKKILSFDLDWVSDSVLDWFIDFLDSLKIKVTVFITHKTPLLKKIYQREYIEVGVHPFFNIIKSDNSEIKDVLINLLDLVPNAHVARSHRLTTSASWNEIYHQSGINFTSNYVMFGNSNIIPWPHLNGIIEVPIYFSDDGFFRINDDKENKFDLNNISFQPKHNSIQVYDFHPIHCFLNTESLKRYESARPFFNDFDELKKYRNNQFGTFDLLKNVIYGERVITHKKFN